MADGKDHVNGDQTGLQHTVRLSPTIVKWLEVVVALPPGNKNAGKAIANSKVE